MADDYFVCPNCWADVPIDALACPECGSDEQTGWSEEAKYDGLWLYNDDDDEHEPAPGWLPKLPQNSWGEPVVSWQRLGIIVVAGVTLSAFLLYAIPWGIYLIPVVILGMGFLYYRSRILPNRPNQIENRLYHNLLLKARGDAGLVERWIAYEQERNPRASRSQLMEDAAFRWEKDNR